LLFEPPLVADAAGAACASRTKSLIKSMLPAMTSGATPALSSWPKRTDHDGSTPLDVKPFSASYPMCATCWNEPAVGPEIMDLSILPDFDTALFFFDDVDFPDK
jgi:hypothetical protein